MAWGADTHTHTHTHTHAYIRTEVISINQARAGLRPARAWFKNDLLRTSLAQTMNFKSTFPGPCSNVSSQHET